MGLFGGDSSSSSTTNNTTNTTSGTVGEFAEDNVVSGGDVYFEGLTGDNLALILANNNANTEQSLYNTRQSAVDAITSVTSAYASSTGTVSDLLNGLKPFAMYGAIGLVAYKLLKG